MGFWAGLVIGWITAMPLALLILGLCNAAARADREAGRK